jgi:carbon-monoxide dehydrogenase medium subunit
VPGRSSGRRALRGASGEASAIRVRAGCQHQSLVPLLALRLARPALLVDINRIPGLAGVTRTAAGGVRVGALTRHRALMEQREYPLLAEAAAWIGHPAIRSRGTLGGSMAHADPAAELPVAAVATGAVVEVTGPGGRREIPADGFFTGPLETSLAPEEIIVAVTFPAVRAWGFAEFARRHGDFGLVIVVAADTGGQRRLAIGGVGPAPVRPVAAEALAAGGTLGSARIGRVAEQAASEIDPPGDVHAPAGYRRFLTRALVRQALEQLAGSAGRS